MKLLRNRIREKTYDIFSNMDGKVEMILIKFLKDLNEQYDVYDKLKKKKGYAKLNKSEKYFKIKGRFMKDYPKQNIVKDKLYLINFAAGSFVRAVDDYTYKGKDELLDEDNVLMVFERTEEQKCKIHDIKRQFGGDGYE